MSYRGLCMKVISVSWVVFKGIVGKKAAMKYIITDTSCYDIWYSDKDTRFETTIKIDSPANVDQLDFEANHKAGSNLIGPIDEQGREYLRAEAKPVGTGTVFVTQADNVGIGDGKVLSWDFSNGDDDISAPVGFKKKRLEFKFLDDVYVKEGAVYYHNAIKGSYLDFYVVCPAGQYYYDNILVPHLAGVDTPVSHYVIHQMMQGTVAMGDEMNTETVSDKITLNYKFWIEVTVPDIDVASNGWVNLELYRKRSVVL